MNWTLSATAVEVTERSQVSTARRAAAALCLRLGFDRDTTARCAVVVSELATNLARHAQAGRLVLSPVECGGVNYLQIISLDRGPGMAEPRLCLEDGYSSDGRGGNGLGAARRMSLDFDLFSQVGKGSVISALLGPEPLPEALRQVAALRLPKDKRRPCGDAVAVKWSPRSLQAVMADGLGHGARAAEASERAVAEFLADGSDLTEYLRSADQALEQTRGAAVAALEVDFEEGRLAFCGVGNVAGVTLNRQGRRSMVSLSGIVGHNLRKVRRFEYDVARDDTIVLFSDGMSGRWGPRQLPPALCQVRPAILAGLLLRDFYKGRDDVAVKVAKGLCQ